MSRSDRCPNCGYTLHNDSYSVDKYEPRPPTSYGSGALDDNVLDFHGLRTVYATLAADVKTAASRSGRGVLHDHYTNQKRLFDAMDYVCSVGKNYAVLTRGHRPVELEYYFDEGNRYGNERSVLRRIVDIWDNTVFRSGRTVIIASAEDDVTTIMNNAFDRVVTESSRYEGYSIDRPRNGDQYAGGAGGAGRYSYSDYNLDRWKRNEQYTGGSRPTYSTQSYSTQSRPTYSTQSYSTQSRYGDSRTPGYGNGDPDLDRLIRSGVHCHAFTVTYSPCTAAFQQHSTFQNGKNVEAELSAAAERCFRSRLRVIRK